MGGLQTTGDKRTNETTEEKGRGEGKKDGAEKDKEEKQ